MNRLFGNNVEPLTLEGGLDRLRTRPERINEADTTSASPSSVDFSPLTTMDSREVRSSESCLTWF